MSPIILALVFFQIVFTNAEVTCQPQDLEQLWDFFKAQEENSKDDNYAIVPGLLPYIPWDCDGVREKRHLMAKRPNIVKKHEGHRHKRHFIRQACAKGFRRINGRCYEIPKRTKSSDRVSRTKRSYLASTRFLCPQGYTRRKFKCVPSHFRYGLG